jgi:hypothetical protein
MLSQRKEYTLKPVIKESARSEEVRDELRKQGFTIAWDVREGLTRIGYWNNGKGKSILLLEHAVDMQWQGCDIFGQLTPENNTAKTYAALAEFAGNETKPKPKPYALVTISGGVADLTVAEGGVEVDLLDYDNLESTGADDLLLSGREWDYLKKHDLDLFNFFAPSFAKKNQ